MVKVPNYKSYAALKEQLSQKLAQRKKEAEARLKDAKEYLEPKVKEGMKTSADLTERAINEAKDAYNKVKQKAQPKVDEFISDIQYAVNPPKIEVLSKKVTSLEKKYLHKSLYLNELERRFPGETLLISKTRSELQQFEQETIKAREEYNKFAASQAAMQQAFERINKVNS